MRKIVVVVLACAACSPNGPRDVTNEHHDVVQTDAGTTAEGYEYVVKKAHGTLALAESRGIPKEIARQAMDRLGNDFESCLAKMQSLKPGAARVIIPLDPGGIPLQPLVKVSEGDAASTTLLCLVAPVRMLSFPAPTKGGPTPGLAVEATWPNP